MEEGSAMTMEESAAMTTEQLLAAVERAKERLRRAFASAAEKHPDAFSHVRSWRDTDIISPIIAAAEALPDLSGWYRLEPISQKMVIDALRFEHVTQDQLQQFQPVRKKQRR
jgi:hypothetical protein